MATDRSDQQPWVICSDDCNRSAGD